MSEQLQARRAQTAALLGHYLPEERGRSKKREGEAINPNFWMQAAGTVLSAIGVQITHETKTYQDSQALVGTLELDEIDLVVTAAFSMEVYTALNGVGYNGTVIALLSPAREGRRVIVSDKVPDVRYLDVKDIDLLAQLAVDLDFEKAPVVA